MSGEDLKSSAVTKKNGASVTVRHTLILVTAAVIWGFTFVSQSIGADYVGASTFLTLRSWLATVFLVPVIWIADRIRYGKNKDIEENTQLLKQSVRNRRKKHIFGGIVCGSLMFLASFLQQVGIAYTTTAKAGFLTAMYVVLVPIISMLAGKFPGKKIWICVALSVMGLYFLCMKRGIGFSYGDLLMLASALCFALQILAVNHFSAVTDGIRLSQMQMMTAAIIASFFMIFGEHPTWAQIRPAFGAIAFAGIMSSGVAYTLQIIGQKDLNPTIASLAMSLESVFSAIGGWLLLHQELSGRELFGCALMFAAIILSQIPLPDHKMKRKEKEEA
jgi:drug/metabolite transporter (DMT)-like permease